MKAPVHTDIQISVHHNTWTFLASRLHGEPLLPSLYRLQIPADVEDIAPLLFCLSPTIRAFTLEFKDGGDAVTSQNMKFIGPFMNVISDPSDHPLPPWVCQLITRKGDAEEIMQHLRTSARLRMLEELDLDSMMIYSIHHSAVTALSRLPSLRKLDAALCAHDHDPSTIQLLTFANFASLHHLSLSSLPLSIVSGTLTISGLRTSQLRSITLNSSVWPPDRTRNPLPIAEFQYHLALIRAALPDALKALRFLLNYNTRTELPKPLSTLFAPFLSLGHLEIFDLAFYQGYVPHVLDDDLRALAEAWSRLEVLRVWVWQMRSPTFSSARPPTAAGLVELAKGSPRLRRVTLPALDVSALPEISALPSEGHKGVQFLDVGALVKDDGVAVEDVARVLGKVFPCVEEYPRVAAEERAQLWGKVQSTMREIQAARRGVGRE